MYTEVYLEILKMQGFQVKSRSTRTRGDLKEIVFSTFPPPSPPKKQGQTNPKHSQLAVA